MSIVMAIRETMPSADILYVADRGRAPYGTRTLQEVADISHDVAEWLIDRGATTLVVACNTASAAALKSLREAHAIPIVGMEPAVKPAGASTRSGVVGVFATAATFQGMLFQSVVDRHAADITVLTAICPEWVDLVESGNAQDEGANLLISPIVDRMTENGADVLVLGCTHFSFLRAAISRAAGEGVTVIDPSEAVAAQTKRVASAVGGDGRLSLAASADLSEFDRLVDRLTGLQADEAVLPFPS